MLPPLTVSLATVVEVAIHDVELQHRAGAGGGLLQHPPQHVVAQRDVAPGADPVHDRPVHGLDLVDEFLAPFARAG